MSEVDQKLRRGFELIERSGGDADMLGVALLSIHGALEDHFRATLSARPDLSAEDRAALAERGAGWLTLVKLMQKYGTISSVQRRTILEANDIRQSFAHGEPFNGRVSSLLRYGRFAETLCGRSGLLDQVLVERRYARAASAEESRATAPRAYDRAAPAPQRSGLTLGQFLSVAALIVVLALGVWAYNAIFHGASGAPPSSGVDATAALPPTPAPLQARVINLGGAIGWLHDAPTFDSGTLPIQLKEGMQVVLGDQQQTDADGHVWRFVSVGGYDGWCPADNLQLDIAPNAGP